MDIVPVMSVLVAGSVLLTVSIVFVALKEYPNPLALPIAMLSAGAAIWVLPIGIGFFTTVLDHHLLLQRMRYIGTVIVPIAYYLVAFRYAGYPQFVRVRILGILAIIPAVTLVLVWTSHLHDLVWESVAIVNVSGLWTVTFEYGPWFGIHLFWSYALIIVALAVLGWEVISVGSHHRRQALFVFFAGAVPLILNVAYFAEIDSLSSMDMTPIAIGVGGAILGLGLLLFDLVELRPVAQERLFEQLRDGVIVLDTAGRIRESNPVARQVLTALDINPQTDQDIPEVVTAGMEIDATVNGSERSYRVEVSKFFDGGGRSAGSIVYLHDITEIARREQRISVLHRVLRHNIRNEMTVLYGHLEYAQATANADIADDLKTIERSADRIMGFAENARIIERTLQRGSESEKVYLEDAVQHAIGVVCRRLDDLKVSIPDDLGAVPPVQVVDRELTQHAIAELLENAVIHGSGKVEVAIEIQGPWIDICVTDEGPGIPRGEIDALDAPVETALEHGSGLGLWVARWTAELSGGSLRFEREDDTNIVSIRLPLEES